MPSFRFRVPSTATIITHHTRQRARLEEEFDELLAEYGDEEIGELEDPAEENAETQGQLQVMRNSRDVDVV